MYKTNNSNEMQQGRNPMPTPRGAFETRWKGPLFACSWLYYPKLNLDLARNRCQSGNSNEIFQPRTKRTRQVRIRRTRLVRRRLAPTRQSERAKTTGEDWREKGPSLAFLFVRTRTFQQPLSVITTVWIVTHEYLFQRPEHLNLEVKVANLTQKGLGKNNNNKQKNKNKNFQKDMSGIVE